MRPVGVPTPVELTVAVLEAGYETSMSRINLHNTVARVLRQGKFTKVEGGKWVRG